jgi:hypothetical protein
MHSSQDFICTNTESKAVPEIHSQNIENLAKYFLPIPEFQNLLTCCHVNSAKFHVIADKMANF